MDHSYPVAAGLKILSPWEETIPAEPAYHIKSTESTGIKGELVYAGIGGEGDYAGLDVRGKVVLTDMNWAPARPEKAVIAYAKGAAALLIMNWGLADKENRLSDGCGKIAMREPDSGVTRRDSRHTGYFHLSLSRRIFERFVSARICTDLAASEGNTGLGDCQGDGRLFGLRPAGRAIFDCGFHLDAWGRSAIRNATGNALV
ncbi:MAG: PA domain-containing protein [bacterium]|jgi:hypothetical protein